MFVRAAEVAIDEGQHVIASQGLTAPSTFAGVFTRLAEAEILTAELADRLAAMARFRHLLVHGYADVDDDRVVETLHGDAVSDLAGFRRELARVLDRERRPDQ